MLLTYSFRSRSAFQLTCGKLVFLTNFRLSNNWLHFSSYEREPATLTFEFDLDRVKVNHHVTVSSFKSYYPVIQTHNRPITLPGPLDRSVKGLRQNFNQRRQRIRVVVLILCTADPEFGRGARQEIWECKCHFVSHYRCHTSLMNVV